MTVYTCALDTPLGAATVTAEDDALTGFWFVGQKYYCRNGHAPQSARTVTLGRSAPPEWSLRPNHPVFTELRAWIAAYFSGENPRPCFPLTPHGTLFQKTVWALLLRIPYGETTTYGALAALCSAQKDSTSTSARAVGGAVGHNPISLLIPCHRVVGATGALTGYAGGLDKKRFLLRLEGMNGLPAIKK